ncbi:MAG: 50S ribosomal protein L11 methyltransferase, partial [Candidatus Omnitrophica bacterium]|nr:50S ribosomal protein L11 methyltransferase [Candidatus Omnitrophota bacterium]
CIKHIYTQIFERSETDIIDKDETFIAGNIELRLGDFFDEDFSTYDLIFIAWPIYHPDIAMTMKSKLKDKLGRELKKGAYFVITRGSGIIQLANLNKIKLPFSNIAIEAYMKDEGTNFEVEAEDWAYVVLADTKRDSSSPLKDLEKRGYFRTYSCSSPLLLKDVWLRLKKENFEQRLRALYGLSKEEAEAKDPYLAKIGFDGKENRLGWTVANLDWLFAQWDEVEKIKADARLIRDRFKYVIFCGMGGSGLSIEVVKNTFGQKDVCIFSLRTTDPAAIAEILDEISRKDGSLKSALDKTLVIPISKSGTTPETVSHKKYFEELFAKFGINIKEHMWVITDKGSPMDTKEYPQREIQLNGKGDIGGRFTAPTTNVFLLPLALLSEERIWPILEKTRLMNNKEDFHQDIYLQLGAFLYYMAYFGKDKVTLIVPESLRSIPLWAEQLFEESLGKDGKGVTLFYGEYITPGALKSVGENDRIFVRINLGGYLAQQDLWKYLCDNGYPVFEINLEDLNEIGGLMLGLQRTVAAIGYLWDINFVNQPAVEGYKTESRKIIAALKPNEVVKMPQAEYSVSFGNLTLYYYPLIEAKILTKEEIVRELDALNLGIQDAAAIYTAILNILGRKGGYLAQEIISYGRMTPGLREIFENARCAIFNQILKLPTKLGEGPDKNHSYHQNIEAGRDMWFSLYFMPLNMKQPPALNYDENLLKAQALGTVNSLKNKGRKVVLLTANTTAQAAEAEVREFFGRIRQYLKESSLKESSSPLKLPGKRARAFLKFLEWAMKRNEKEIKKVWTQKEMAEVVDISYVSVSKYTALVQDLLKKEGRPPIKIKGKKARLLEIKALLPLWYETIPPEERRRVLGGVYEKIGQLIIAKIFESEEEMKVFTAKGDTAEEIAKETGMPINQVEFLISEVLARFSLKFPQPITFKEARQLYQKAIHKNSSSPIDDKNERKEALKKAFLERLQGKEIVWQGRRGKEIKIKFITSSYFAMVVLLGAGQIQFDGAIVIDNYFKVSVGFIHFLFLSYNAKVYLYLEQIQSDRTLYKYIKKCLKNTLRPRSKWDWIFTEIYPPRGQEKENGNLSGWRLNALKAIEEVFVSLGGDVIFLDVTENHNIVEVRERKNILKRRIAGGPFTANYAQPDEKYKEMYLPKELLKQITHQDVDANQYKFWVWEISSSPLDSDDNVKYLERELQKFFKGKIISEYILPDRGEKVTYTGGVSHDFYYFRAKDIFIIEARFYNQLKDLCDTKDVVVLFIEKAHFLSMDYFPWTLAVLIAIQRLNLRGKKVVDFGAAEGIPVISAAKLGAAQAIGIDYSEGAVNTLIRNVQFNNCADNIYCIHERFENLYRRKADILDNIDIAIINLPAFGKVYFKELGEYLGRANFVVISGAHYRNFPAFNKTKIFYSYDTEYFETAHQLARQAFLKDGFEIIALVDLILKRMERSEVYPAFIARPALRNTSSPLKKTGRLPSVKGKKKRGVSKWDLLNEFRQGLNNLPQALILELAAAKDIGSQRKILKEAGLDVANEIDGKFFITEVNKVLQKLPLPEEDAVQNNYLRYGGNGRYLTAYIGEGLDFIVKTYSDPSKKKIVQAKWIEEGFEVARQRLGGLAAPTLIIDTTGEAKKDFVFVLEGGSLIKTDLAIIQLKVIRLLDYLKMLVRSKKLREAKESIDKFKEIVLLMFARGVIDADCGGMVANYGIKPKSREIYIFDFGDLSYSSYDADGFMGSLLVTNEYIEDALRSEVDDTIADYFRNNAFKASDFDDGNLFGADLTQKDSAKFIMKFPYSEKEIRRMFAPASSSSPLKDAFQKLLEKGSNPYRLNNKEFNYCKRQSYRVGSFGFIHSPAEVWPRLNIDFVGKRFLDVGCGALGADVMYAWLKGAAFSLGIDRNRWAIYLCRDQLWYLEDLALFSPDRFNFVRAWLDMRSKQMEPPKANNIVFSNIALRDLPEHYFDIINCSCVVQGQENINKLGQKILRVLKPQGIFRFYFK